MNCLKNLAKKLLLMCASLGAVAAISLSAPSEAQAGPYRYLAVRSYPPRVVVYRAPAVVIQRTYPGVYLYAPSVGVYRYGRVEYVPQFVPGVWPR